MFAHSGMRKGCRAAVASGSVAGFDREHIAEDWGYAIRVSVPPDTLLLGFANAFEDDPKSLARHCQRQLRSQPLSLDAAATS